jgi:hypothetical protein
MRIPGGDHHPERALSTKSSLCLARAHSLQATVDLLFQDQYTNADQKR